MLTLEPQTKNYHKVKNDFDTISQKLSKIFEEEMNSQNSILIKVDNGAIAKVAMFLSGTIKRSASIGIAGETASGKSTVTLDIINAIKNFSKKHQIEDVIARINTDDYYYDRSEMVRKAGSFANFAKNYDFDVPEALELSLMKEHIFELLKGNNVMLPKYDMSGTAIRYDNKTFTSPSKIIISEGLFTLTEKVRDAFDFKIYVDIEKSIQEERFYARALDRGLGNSAKNILENANKKAKIHVVPCKDKADIVLSGQVDRHKYVNFMNKILNLVEEIYY